MAILFLWQGLFVLELLFEGYYAILKVAFLRHCFSGCDHSRVHYGATANMDIVADDCRPQDDGARVDSNILS